LELDGTAGVVGAAWLDDEGIVDWEATGVLETAGILVGMTTEEEAGDEAGDDAGDDAGDEAGVLEKTGELEGV
jgi:hypothetical protein